MKILDRTNSSRAEVTHFGIVMLAQCSCTKNQRREPREPRDKYTSSTFRNLLKTHFIRIQQNNFVSLTSLPVLEGRSVWWQIPTLPLPVADFPLPRHFPLDPDIFSSANFNFHQVTLFLFRDYSKVNSQLRAPKGILNFARERRTSLTPISYVTCLSFRAAFATKDEEVNERMTEKPFAKNNG